MEIDNLEVASTGNKTFRLKDARGKKLIVYFYPKDDTPGCTVEGADFRDLYPQFQQLNCEIVGVSRDSVSSHERFKTKLGLPFDLLADENEAMCNSFRVFKLKNVDGNEVRGIDRSTFLFDETGKIMQEWRSVKSAGHAQAVLDTLKAL